MLKGHRRVLLQAVRALDTRAVDGRSSSDADSSTVSSAGGSGTASAAAAAAMNPEQPLLLRSASDGSARDVGFGGGGLGAGWGADAGGGLSTEASHSSPAVAGGGWDAIPGGAGSRYAVSGLGGGCGDFDEEPRRGLFPPPVSAAASPAGGGGLRGAPAAAAAAAFSGTPTSGLLAQTGGTGSGGGVSPRPSPFGAYGRAHELAYSEISLGDRVGEGSFGVVRRGSWRGMLRCARAHARLR